MCPLSIVFPIKMTENKQRMSKTRRKILEQSIKTQCFEFESILDDLRLNQFDKHKYERFHKTTEKYYEQIKDHSTINRETVGYLDTFHSLLEWAFTYHNDVGSNSKIRDQLQTAWEETTELMNKIYFGNSTDT